MRTITALITGLLFVATALPAVAADKTVTISHEHGTPQIVEVTGDSQVKTAIVGHFLWVLYDDAEPGEFASDSDQRVSVDVSDSTIRQAVVNDNGTVTLIRESVTEPDNEPAPEPETVNLITRLPEFEVF